MSSYVDVSVQTCAELVQNFFQFSDMLTCASDTGVLPMFRYTDLSRGYRNTCWMNQEFPHIQQDTPQYTNSGMVYMASV